MTKMEDAQEKEPRKFIRILKSFTTDSLVMNAGQAFALPAKQADDYIKNRLAKEISAPREGEPYTCEDGTIELAGATCE
jgi:hypothetical protein